MYYEKVLLNTKKQIVEYQNLLEDAGLKYEEKKYKLGVYLNKELVGGISFEENCILQLVVREEFKGKGISNILISEVIKYAFTINIFHLFVYTKPDNETQFNDLGFHTIIKVDNVVFLENKRNGIVDYCKELESKKVAGEKIGSLVMNLNPITLGHKYLIDKALEKCDHVHIFVVKENKSVFEYEDRYRLLKEVVKDYEDVTVHNGSEYIISTATFPTYFIKSEECISDAYAKLDTNIFGKYISKALNINYRYVGTEPYCKTTNVYNKNLKEELPKYGVVVEEISRIEIESNTISASKVRELIKKGEVEESYKFLPNATKEFLKTEKGKETIKKIVGSGITRH